MTKKTKMTMEDAEKIVTDKNKFENYTPEEIKMARNMMMQDATGPLLDEGMVNVGGEFMQNEDQERVAQIGEYKWQPVK